MMTSSSVTTCPEPGSSEDVISAEAESEDSVRAPPSTSGVESRTYVHHAVSNKTRFVCAQFPVCDKNDDVTESPSDNHCDCFDQNDNQRFSSLVLRRQPLGGTNSGREIYMECQRCGRLWPIENGECFVGCGARRRIRRLGRPLDELHLGDHVLWTRVFGGISYHHGIVSSVQSGLGRIWLVAFQLNPRWSTLWPNSVDGSTSGTCTNGQVRRECLLVSRLSTPIYVVEYHRCYPDHVVLARAISRLGEQGYSVYANNCEHFANWCKIGADQSSQAEMAIAPYRLSCNLVLGVFDRLVARRCSSWTASVFNTVTFALGCVGLIDCAVPELLVTATATATAIQVDLVLVISVNALVDGVSIGSDVVEAVRKRRAGVLSHAEFADRIVGTVARGLLGSTGSIVGCLIGAVTAAEEASRGGEVVGLVYATAASAVGWSIGWIIGRLIHRHWRTLANRIKA